jgi:hypothetical protein
MRTVGRESAAHPAEPRAPNPEPTMRKKPGPKGPRPDTAPRRLVSARIPQALADRLDAEAERSQRSRQRVIEDALAQALSAAAD